MSRCPDSIQLGVFICLALGRCWVFFITEYVDKSQELLVGKTHSPAEWDKGKRKYLISVQEDEVTTQKLRKKKKKINFREKFYNLFLENHASR